MSEETKLELRQPDAVAVQPQADMMSVIAKAASDPNVDVDKMERLLAMAERMEAIKRETAFNEALVRVQALIPQIDQNGVMDRGPGKGTIPYAKLEDIDKVVRPIYSAEGFAIAWDCQPQADGRLFVTGRLKHRMGHSEPFSVVMPLDPSGGKTGPQSVTSAVAYAKRTVVKMLFNIIEKGADTNGKDITTITQEQADTMRDKLAELGANIPQFMQIMGVAKLTDILASDLENAWEKIRQKEQRVRGGR
jgi:hypothetical protein